MAAADDERAPRQRPPANHRHHHRKLCRPTWQARLAYLDPLGLRWLLLAEGAVLAVLLAVGR